MCLGQYRIAELSIQFIDYLGTQSSTMTYVYHYVYLFCPKLNLRSPRHRGVYGGQTVLKASTHSLFCLERRASTVSLHGFRSSSGISIKNADIHKRGRFVTHVSSCTKVHIVLFQHTFACGVGHAKPIWCLID